MTRAAIYARYSTDLQSEASIEDQVRLCRAHADREGWTIIDTLADRSISGTSLLRPGYQAVMELARNGDIDIILAESLDRLSRDQEETAALFKRLQFFGVELMTVSEGQITELHVGLKGTMNALYLKDLAMKTHRGLEGRVREGRSGGGNSYGYAVVEERDGSGDLVRGGRRIDERQADIVRRIFRNFSDGLSPKSIAHTLNEERVPGPTGNAWGPSTIYGNWRRGTGILNNELYVGRLVWNRLRYVKDPSTGKRVSQPNPPDALVVTEVPDLRIIDDELWQRVKDRQESTRKTVTDTSRGVRSERARRPAYLLSGLLTCGTCGGGFSKISRDHYGCSRARNQGTCDNRLTIRRDDVEARVLNGLRSRLMQPDAVKLFVEEFNAEISRSWSERHGHRLAQEQELARLQSRIDKTVDAIIDGNRSQEIKDRLAQQEARKAELTAALAKPAEPMPALHPGIADTYARKVDNLATALNDPAIRQEASEAIRALIQEVRLTLEDGVLQIELFGELAALLTLSAGHIREHPRAGAGGVQVTLVAGA